MISTLLSPYIIVLLVVICAVWPTESFTSQGSNFLSRYTQAVIKTQFKTRRDPPFSKSTSLHMAQISESEAKKGIDKVVAALRRDKSAKEELGNLTKVNNILGFGSPKPGQIAVRFNASFQKSGKGMSSIPMPFGLGQTNQSEGRGTMVGQVKASIDQSSGKVVECSVFRDLGYGRAFNLKV